MIKVNIYLLTVMIISLLVLAKNIYKKKHIRVADDLGVDRFDSLIGVMVNANTNANVTIRLNSKWDKIRITKKQDNEKWWLELSAKEDVMVKIYNILKYSNRFKSSIQSNFSSVQLNLILGTDESLLTDMVKYIIIHLFEINENSLVFIDLKNFNTITQLDYIYK